MTATYEYKDLFVKTCDEIDGKGSCNLGLG